MHDGLGTRIHSDADVLLISRVNSWFWHFLVPGEVFEDHGVLEDACSVLGATVDVGIVLDL